MSPCRAFLVVVFAVCMAGSSLRAADTVPAPDAVEVRAALERASASMRAIATEGGYLWRYSADLSVRGGEGPATATQIWVQSPGTPAVGHVFLEAWRATGDAAHLIAARAAALALVHGQLESGGWNYLIEFDPTERASWRYRTDTVDAAKPGKRRKNTTTFDDDTTQGALRYLIAFLAAAKNSPDPADAQIQEALDYGLAQVIEAQYPNGAWPQRWDGAARDPALYPVLKASIPKDYPREQPDGAYHTHYTFNDGALPDLVRTMLDAWRHTGREAYRDAARRGGDFILLSQLPEPQPGWAQQYDVKTQPAWARAFEPPAVSSAESVGVLQLLIDLHVELGDEDYLAAIPPATAWLKRSGIAPGRWARLYELGTNRPIYGDRDRRIHYTLEEISEERRAGYAWEGGFGVEATIARSEKLLALGRGEFRRQQETRPLDPGRRAARTARDASTVREVIDRLDADGRWLTQSRASRIDSSTTTWIETREFIRNARLLCDYLVLLER